MGIWLTEGRSIRYTEKQDTRSASSDMVMILPLSGLVKVRGLVSLRQTPTRLDSGANVTEMAKPLHGSALGLWHVLARTGGKDHGYVFRVET
jgi:hypothetical protein